MASLKKVEAKFGGNCSCCSERWRTCESYLQVVEDNGKNRRGERYCLNCEEYARMNNDDLTDGNDAESSAERDRETFAAYQAAGCPSEYFNDKQAGYA